MTLSELADRLGIAPATASVMVGQLSRGGLISGARTNMTADALSIAPARRRAIDRWLSSRTDPMGRTLEQLSARDRGVFVEALKLLDRELKAPKEGGR